MAELVVSSNLESAEQPVASASWVAKPSWRIPTIICLALALATAWVYWAAPGHDFIGFDDPDYVAKNQTVQGGLTMAGVKWAFTTGHASNWHPLTWLSHMLDSEVFGAGPRGPHVVNVALHIANALALFLLLSRVTAAVWRSAFVAALFALHPLRVESVAWIAERKDVLSGFFFLLTVWAYARYATEGRSRRWYVAALLLFAGALMSKPMVVTLPCVLLLLDYWPLRRFEGQPGSAVGKLLAEKIPFFALTAVSCAVTFLVQHRGGAVGSLGTFSLGERLANAIVACARYLEKTIWPTELAIFYPHPRTWPWLTLAFALLALALLGIAVARWGRRHPFVAVGVLWFLGMLVPTLGLVQVGLQSMADRYTYLPSIGLFIFIAWGGWEVLRDRRAPAAAVAALVAMLLAACAVRARDQVRLWQNTETLFGHALAVTRGNFVAHNSLGDALREQGRLGEARGHLEQAIAIWPDFADAHNNLGNLLLAEGRLEAALTHFQRAVEGRPRFALAHYNFGTALLAHGRTTDALEHLNRAAELQPDDALTQLNLGNVYLQRGDPVQALACYARCLELDPRQADAHNNSGQALLQQGKVTEALRSFQAALSVQPDHANAHYSLGEVYLRRRQMDEAIHHFEKTLAAAPDDADAHQYLAAALAQKGRNQEAAAHRDAAARLRAVPRAP